MSDTRKEELIQERQKRGVNPLQDILGAVRATGWEGVLSFELFREEYWRLDPLTVAREAKARTIAV